MAILPPLQYYARHYEYVESLQFCLVALAVPALAVIGWPLRLLRGTAGARWRPLFERLAAGRRRHRQLARSLCFAAFDVAVMVAWRTPAFVDSLYRHQWLLPVEVVTLVLAGLPLWTELVRSPPLEPRLPRPRRAVLAAVTMWAVWVTAYTLGFSHGSWFVAFHHASGGLGVSADQEISAGVLWFGAACSFVPVVFTDVVAWLKDGEDPDAELRTLIRRERWLGPPD